MTPETGSHASADMTAFTNPAAAGDPEALEIDNNLEGTEPAAEPASPSQDPANPKPGEAPVAEKLLDPRVQARLDIAANFRAHRAAEDAPQPEVPAEEPAPEQDEPPAEPAAPAAPAAEPQAFKLKVLGNEVSVSFEQLAEEAGFDADEAKAIPPKTLIRLAQKSLAANAYLDEAKATAKSARAASRATGETTPETPATGTDPEAPSEPAQDQGKAALRDVVEKIQFGDPEEGAEALADAVRKEAARIVKDELTTARIGDKRETVQRDVQASVKAFEEANKDIVGDPDLAAIFYGRHLVETVKDAFVKTGQVSKANADALIRNPQEALEAYESARVDGRVTLPDPAALLAANHARFRARFPAPAAPQGQPPASRLPALDARVAAKRALPSQPTRTAVPTAAPTTAVRGDTPQGRSAAIERMKAKRVGQAA
jgi:hypothetical protein